MGLVSRLDVVADGLRPSVMHTPERNEWFQVAARGFQRMKFNVILLAIDVESHLLTFVSFNHC